MKGVTPPATKLRFGQPAVVEYQEGTKTDSYYQHGTMQVIVTKIQKGDPKIFDKLTNKADFKGLTPYFIYSQNKILSYQGKTDGNPPTSPIVSGVLNTGEDAGSAISFSGSIGCDSTYFDKPVVGATATQCFVALAKTGEQVVAVAYEGDFDLYPSSTANPYVSHPVIWQP